MDHHSTVAGIKIWFVPDTFINVLCRKYFTRMFHQKKQDQRNVRTDRTERPGSMQDGRIDDHVGRWCTGTAYRTVLYLKSMNKN